MRPWKGKGDKYIIWDREGSHKCTYPLFRLDAQWEDLSPEARTRLSNARPVKLTLEGNKIQITLRKAPGANESYLIRKPLNVLACTLAGDALRDRLAGDSSSIGLRERA